MIIEQHVLTACFLLYPPTRRTGRVRQLCVRQKEQLLIIIFTAAPRKSETEAGEFMGIIIMMYLWAGCHTELLFVGQTQSVGDSEH